MAFGEPPRPVGARGGLPPPGAYVRAIVALGLASLRLAVPALALLYFYRLGMGLYLAFSSDVTSPFGGYDSQAMMTAALMRAAAYLPLLVLIYTPFLPLQDSILRGERRSFGTSVRIVLERLASVVGSVILQLLIVLGPPMLLFSGAYILVRTFPARPDSLVRALAVATLVPCFFYILIMGFFLVFAIPAVVLDRAGPFASIRRSFSLVSVHFGGVLGRLLLVFFLLVIVAIALALPAEFLQAAAAATGRDHPLIRVSVAVWTSALEALLFPFSVAALMVLYRSAAPSPVGIPGAAGVTAPGVEPEPRRATSPFQFE